jgi:hypothetical protein
MLVYVRPSNEALLRARVPGALDQRGCPSSFSSCGLREHRKPSNLPAHAPSTFTPPLTGGWPAWAPTARVQQAPSERARCASTGGPLYPSCFSPLYPLGESPDCLSLRASNEHSFIVRVLRARRMVWRLPCPLDRGTPLLAMIPAT